MVLNLKSLHDVVYYAPRENKALIDVAQEKEITYAGLIDYIERFASYLVNETGLHKGERVSILLPNSWQYVVAFYAISLAGGIAVPIDYRLTEREASFLIRDSGSSLLVCNKESLGKFSWIRKIVIEDEIPGTRKNLIETNTYRDSALCILYTGGTTGRQKGVVLTHRNFLSVLSGLNEAWSLRRNEEKFLQFLPMTHSGGLNCGVNSGIFSAGCTIIMRKFDVQTVLNLVEKYRITVMPGVPTVYNELARSDLIDKRELSSLRICFCSGAPLPKSVAEAFKEKTGITINVGWGLTEASPQLTVCPPGMYRENLVGLPLRDTVVATFDENGVLLGPGQVGELGAKGPQIMTGYWNRKEETEAVFTKEGFLLTGDIGYIDPEGFVYLLGRKKNMINTGGYKVWPHEVESAVLENPKIREAAAIGVPDQKYGEAVKLFVVPKENITKEEILEFLRLRIASYKLPRYIEFKDELPKSSVGKILHRVLKEGELSKHQK
jgi:long-chain acyl-CoA synthetase